MEKKKESGGNGLLVLGLLGVGLYLYLSNRKKRGEVEPELEEDMPKVVTKLVKRKTVKKDVVKGNKDLNGRQSKILSLITKGDGITTTDMLKVVRNTTDRTLRRDLNHMISLGLISKSGSTKSSKYYSKK
ncbi:hypothetical protein HYV12_01490 [Candidatus Dojkabacteria bacterium]|nr:hypothetical protein [Candidatus Dojkabacteria bacterium]